MSLDLDRAKFQQIVATTLGAPRLDPIEARVVIEVAQLAGWIDLEAASEERTLLDTVITRLCELGGVDVHTIPPLSPIPTDGEERAMRVGHLAGRLDQQDTRELAYALAYLLIVADLELSPIESTLIDELQRALAIPMARARELVETVSAIVTPTEPPADAEAGLEEHARLEP